MRKIFIDCGAHCGCSSRKFRKELDLKGEYEIFSFEANSHLQTYYKCENKAVWIEDGIHEFYLKSPTSGGSSLLEEKTRHNPENKRLSFTKTFVECFDLDKYIKTFRPDDEIILKMDIEGAEYTVLPHMITGGSISYINQLLIEWHNEKVFVSKDKDRELIEQLRRYGIPISEWDAMKYCIV